jgi:TolB-like protein
MIFSKNSLNKPICIIGCLIVLSGCTLARNAEQLSSPADDACISIAVLPIDNASRAPAPLKDIQQRLTEMLRANCITVLDDKELGQFMAQHRIRYTGGMDELTSQYFATDTAIKAVLITNLELYSETIPPRIALTSRLVSTGTIPEILWIDSVAMTGADKPGILGIGLINKPQKIMENALTVLSDSLVNHLAGGASENDDDNRPLKKFAPTSWYRSPQLAHDRNYTVAVIPFLNKSDRKNAGEYLALQFVEQLSKIGGFNVIEPGLRRQEFLKYRLILDDGLSLANAEILFNTLDVDLIITGIVTDYQDSQGSYGVPAVDFSTLVLEKTSGKVVSGSQSHNAGDNYVHLFDFGLITTAHDLAEKMTKEVVKRLK